MKVILFTLLLLVIFVHIDAQRDKILPLPGNGITRPGTFYQRFRRSHYSSDKPFYQWYYYWIRDAEHNVHYALCYAISLCKPKDPKCKYEGSYVMFARVGPDGNFQKYERYPATAFQFSEHFHIKIANGRFELHPLNNDTYHLKGKMFGTENVWVHEGCDKDLPIEWDLTVHRIYGWYGQEPFELPDRKLMGVIQWNTYSHCSELSGTIKIGGRVFEIKRNHNYRIYGDQNWGTQFPEPPSSNPTDRTYAWGWYYAGIPSPDLSKELSIILGIGRTDTHNILLRTMDGKFGDVNINGTLRFEAREIKIHVGTALETRFESTNDGDRKVRKFDVARSNWISFKDKFGVAEVPLRQIVTVETQNYHLVMDYQSEVKHYNRLLFPYEDFIFSDFEALGVRVNVTIRDKSRGIILKQFETDTGGLEFGFKYNVTLPN